MGPKQHLGRWADDIPRLDNSKQDKESGLTTGNPEFLGKYHMDDLCVCRSQALGNLTYMHLGKQPHILQSNILVVNPSLLQRSIASHALQQWR